MGGFFSELVRRRVPQITAVYVGGGWAMVSFLDWSVERFSLAPGWSEFAFFGLALLFPSVVLLAYFHGATGRQDRHPAVQIGVITNVALAVFLLSTVFRSDLLLGPAPGEQEHVRRQVTFDGTVSEVALSPDGASLAYLVRQDGTTRLMILPVDGEGVEELAATDDLHFLDWNPDGESLQVRSAELGGGDAYSLFSVSVDGRAPDWVGTLPFRAWSADGTAYVETAQNFPDLIVTRPADTGQEQLTITLLDDYQWTYAVYWSPVSDVVAVLRGGRGGAITVVSTTGQEQYVVVEDSVPIVAVSWGNDGSALYSVNEAGGVLRVRVDPSTGAPRGQPEVLAITAIAPPDSRRGLRTISVSKDGTRIAYVAGTRGSNLWALSLDSTGPPPRRLTSGTSSKGSLFGSGTGFGLGFVDSATGERVSVIDVAEETLTVGQLTQLPHPVNSAAWSPESGALALVTRLRDGFGIWLSTTGEDPRPLGKTDLSKNADIAWCGPNEILYQQPGNRNFGFLNTETGEERSLAGWNSGWLFDPACTFDGTMMAFRANTEGGQALWMIATSGENARLIAKGVVVPRVWSPDGQWLYAWDRDENQVIRVSRVGGNPEILFQLPYDPAAVIDVWPMPEAGIVVVDVREGELDVWLEDNFAPPVR